MSYTVLIGLPYRQSTLADLQLRVAFLLLIVIFIAYIFVRNAFKSNGSQSDIKSASPNTVVPAVSKATVGPRLLPEAPSSKEVAILMQTVDMFIFNSILGEDFIHVESYYRHQKETVFWSDNIRILKRGEKYLDDTVCHLEFCYKHYRIKADFVRSTGVACTVSSMNISYSPLLDSVIPVQEWNDLEKMFEWRFSMSDIYSFLSAKRIFKA